MLLKITNNLIINSDHIISAKFRPAAAGIDSEFGESYNNPDRLTITTEAHDITAEYGHEGDTLGYGTKSQEIVLTGEQALKVWQFLTLQAAIL